MKNLTIVTPTLNCGDVFDATLASIKPLLRLGAEHIVVDSGSSDGTVERAEAAGARIISFPKGNMYAAINEGLRAGSREWMTYINGDDLIYADALNEMLKSAGANVDFVYGNIDFIDEVGRFLFYWRCPAPTFLKLATSCYGGIFQQGALFRRTAFLELSGFDENYKYCADTDFFLRAQKKGSTFQKYTKKSVGAFRLLPTQFSQTRGTEMATEGRSIRDRYWSDKPIMLREVTKVCAFGLRNLYNLDSRLIRHLKGRRLDKR